jgi:hypothetical protein
MLKLRADVIEGRYKLVSAFLIWMRCCGIPFRLILFSAVILFLHQREGRCSFLVWELASRWETVEHKVLGGRMMLAFEGRLRTAKGHYV